jgi:hypothetical protein
MSSDCQEFAMGQLVRVEKPTCPVHRGSKLFSNRSRKCRLSEGSLHPFRDPGRMNVYLYRRAEQRALISFKPLPRSRLPKTAAVDTPSPWLPQALGPGIEK